MDELSRSFPGQDFHFSPLGALNMSAAPGMAFDDPAGFSTEPAGVGQDSQGRPLPLTDEQVLDPWAWPHHRPGAPIGGGAVGLP